MVADPWALLATARVARFATLAPDGRPALVPVCFAMEGQTIFHAVDHKPKATRALARVRNIEADPRATLLADHYDDEDWNELWWVRAEGTARILPEAPHAIDLLMERYPQYREQRPQGPVIALDVQRIRGWEASRSSPRRPQASS